MTKVTQGTGNREQRVWTPSLLLVALHRMHTARPQSLSALCLRAWHPRAVKSPLFLGICLFHISTKIIPKRFRDRNWFPRRFFPSRRDFQVTLEPQAICRRWVTTWSMSTLHVSAGTVLKSTMLSPQILTTQREPQLFIPIL